MAVNQLQALISQKKEAYGVFGAPCLSEESMKICRENGIGFINMAGNWWGKGCVRYPTLFRSEKLQGTRGRSSKSSFRKAFETPMVTKADYGKDEVKACLSVMVEPMTLLGEFREHIVFIGGWVPCQEG